jgi:hypothetical protein
MLSGTVSDLDDLAESDYRRTRPEDLITNQCLDDVVRAVAASHGCTLGQIALAWVLSKGSDVVPIPGIKRQRYLTENLDALTVELTAGGDRGAGRPAPGKRPTVRPTASPPHSAALELADAANGSIWCPAGSGGR